MDFGIHYVLHHGIYGCQESVWYGVDKKRVRGLHKFSEKFASARRCYLVAPSRSDAPPPQPTMCVVRFRNTKCACSCLDVLGCVYIVYNCEAGLPTATAVGDNFCFFPS